MRDFRNARQNDAGNTLVLDGHVSEPSSVKVHDTLPEAALPDPGPQFLGDDIGDNTSTTTSIAVGGTVSSVINHSGDLDYFRVNLVAGQTYTFSVAGMSDAYVELRDSAGALVAENDDGGILLNAFLMTRVAQTGTYYVVARGYNGSVTGNYTLAVNAITTGNTSPTQFADNGKPQFSWDEAAIQISRSGASWANAFGSPTVVTYAYRSTAPGAMPDDTGGFTQFTAAQIAATELALSAWAAVANITFVRANDGGGYSNNASILFGNYATGAEGAAAFAYTPIFGSTAANDVEGDVWINSSLSYNANPLIGEYGQQVLMHEIGHALGLSHPGDYNAAPGVTIEYGTHAVYFDDSRMFTMMSYFASASTGATLGAFASLPQLHDIAAIQRLYGANLGTRTGDSTYGFNSNVSVTEYQILSSAQAAVFTIWDGGGVDTLDLSGYSTASTIDLRQEAYSSAGPASAGLAVFNIAIARGVVIENAIGGAGADHLIGNDANNQLNGGAGADAMEGGNGNDTYFVDSSGDVVTEASPTGGVDTVNSSINDYLLPSNVENLTLIGAGVVGGGNSLDNVIIGNALNNTIFGLAGNDTLDGGAGVDIMDGGDGDDTYVVDTYGETVWEGSALGGTDTVRAGVDYLLPGNVENLVLIGAALNGGGNSLNNVITGNALNNLIWGLAGNDTLDGGAGVDIMDGGDGDDTYVVDTYGETVWEGSALGGTDTVRALIDYLLPGNVENLVLIGAALNGGGNSLNNVITGNATNNLIWGLAGNDTLDGGAGVDIMDGGDGDDTYIVDTFGETVWEGSALGGNDTVRALIDYLLPGNVENLTLLGLALNGGGNGLANVITGNALNNLIWGLAGNDTLDGGAGVDVMDGGDGDDTYIVDTYGETVWEGSALGGNDTVRAGVDYLLPGNVENLVLTGASLNGGGNSLNNVITGNASNNLIWGLAGNDTLDGGGGVDIMDGGDGDDTYVVDSLGETVWEGSALGGNDTVRSSVNYTLPGNVENLVLIGNSAINGSGNGLANVITGNGAANTLTGGGGADAFVFNTPLGGGNVDTITDFAHGVDVIRLDNAIFTSLIDGALAAGAFNTGAGALDADDRIIYNPVTGALFYDPDGAGGAAAIQFATLATGLSLTASDFFII